MRIAALLRATVHEGLELLLGDELERVVKQPFPRPGVIICPRIEILRPFLVEQVERVFVPELEIVDVVLTPDLHPPSVLVLDLVGLVLLAAVAHVFLDQVEQVCIHSGLVVFVIDSVVHKRVNALLV